MGLGDIVSRYLLTKALRQEYNCVNMIIFFQMLAILTSVDALMLSAAINCLTILGKSFRPKPSWENI